jgi:hypothetical protein
LIEIWLLFAEAVYTLSIRLGPPDEATVQRALAQLLGALRDGALLAEGQFGNDKRGIAPEYKPISDGWWVSTTSIGNFDSELPFNVTVN